MPKKILFNINGKGHSMTPLVVMQTYLHIQLLTSFYIKVWTTINIQFLDPENFLGKITKGLWIFSVPEKSWLNQSAGLPVALHCQGQHYPSNFVNHPSSTSHYIATIHPAQYTPALAGTDSLWTHFTATVTFQIYIVASNTFSTNKKFSRPIDCSSICQLKDLLIHFPTR